MRGLQPVVLSFSCAGVLCVRLLIRILLMARVSAVLLPKTGVASWQFKAQINPFIVIVEISYDLSEETIKVKTGHFLLNISIFKVWSWQCWRWCPPRRECLSSICWVWWLRPCRLSSWLVYPRIRVRGLRRSWLIPRIHNFAFPWFQSRAARSD